MLQTRQIAVIVVVALAMATGAFSQAFPSPLDPARNIAVASPTPPHVALSEEYIWTADDVTAKRPDHNKFPWNRPDLRITPHLFRAKFRVAAVPTDATLYVAGPREAHVFLNGHKLDDFYINPDAPIGFYVFHTSASAALRAGDNVLAIEAIRGRGVVSGTGPVATQQLAYGEVLAVKIIPARYGVEAPAVVISDGHWRSIPWAPEEMADHWSEATFDDSAWPAVRSLGPVESNVDFLQWSADAGMYGWPGYLGMSPGLRTFSLPATSVSHIFSGRASFANLASLTSESAAAPFTVTNESAERGSDADAPSLLLDFGREIAGRLLVESASSSDATISIGYGESEIEALATGLTPGQQGGNYLGTNVLEVPASGVARGPKSGFRYVRVRFLRGAAVTAFKSIRAEGIYYPVTYAGSFESSDSQLNRIWEVGAYTAHLCMQDGIWDAPKRDRGRWAGDLEIEGRAISTAFGDHELMESTLHSLVPSEGTHVNGIPGYSALWVQSLYDLYSRSGNREFVASERAALLQILATMDASLGPDGIFSNAKHLWLFVDWAPGLYGYTNDAVIGTNLQYAIAYSRASLLFRMLGDQANAEKYATQSGKLLAAVRSRFRDAGAPTFGTTWQLNALANLAFEGDHDGDAVVWSRILSHVKQDAPADQIISPYSNAYVLDAMAETGHRKEALDWIRTYWGGMLAEGATSFWESYDLRWPKTNPHLSLQADGTSGYFVSMAHGWSSGPTAWLAENILGIRDPHDGYKTVTIAPQLAALDWARGSVPTPHGIISIRIEKGKGVALDLPPGVEKATVRLSLDQPSQHLYLNGVPTPGAVVELIHPGHYEFIVR